MHSFTYCLWWLLCCNRDYLAHKIKNNLLFGLLHGSLPSSAPKASEEQVLVTWNGLEFSPKVPEAICQIANSMVVRREYGLDLWFQECSRVVGGATTHPGSSRTWHLACGSRLKEPRQMKGFWNGKQSCLVLLGLGSSLHRMNRIYLWL